MDVWAVDTEGNVHEIKVKEEDWQEGTFEAIIDGRSTTVRSYGILAVRHGECAGFLHERGAALYASTLCFASVGRGH